jgi:hypothetical protein
MALVNDYFRHYAGVDRDVLLDALQRVEDAVWGTNRVIISVTLVDN